MTTRYYAQSLADPVETFVRNSVAYDESGSHAIDVRRTCSLALPSTSDGSIPAAEGAGGLHLRPLCRNANYMFANTTSGSGHVYRSTDGTAWSASGVDGSKATGTSGGMHAICLDSGRLVLFRDIGAKNTGATITDSGVANPNEAGHNKALLTKSGAFTSTIGGCIWVDFSDAAYTDGYYYFEYYTANTVYLKKQDGTYLSYEADDATVGFKRGQSVTFSDDDGVTFTLGTGFFPKINYAGDAASYCRSWSIKAHGNVIIVGEYGAASTLGGQYIHVSYDGGATWSVSFDLETGLSGLYATAYHVHAIGYHAATGRWLAFMGDSGYAGVLYSDDDGVTWHNLIGVRGSFQPIWAYDNGHATKLLVGYDGDACFGTIDVLTGEYESLFNQGNPYTSLKDCFLVHKVGSVYYFGMVDMHATAPEATLVVSTDLVNFSVYHRFILADYDTDKGVEGFDGCYAGSIGGKLHFSIRVDDAGVGEPRHFIISPANVRNVGGVLITPAVTNILSANQSSQETSCDITNLSETTPTQSHDALIGSHAAQILTTGTGATGTGTGKTCVTSNFALANGTSYIISAYVKANIPCKMSMTLRKNTTDNSAIAWFGVDKNWRRIYSPAIAIAADGSDYNIKFTLWQFGTDIITAQIDAIQVKELPICEFALGGTAQAADLLTEAITTPSAFTDIFAVQTIGQHTHYAAAADLYIKTWKVGSDELQLFWDVSESKFTIQRNAETAVASVAQVWSPNQVIKFALRADASGLTLDIQNGRAIETLTDSALAALLSASMTLIYGNVSSAAQFPGVYFDGLSQGAQTAGFGIFPFKFTDAQVVASLNLKPTVGTLRTTAGGLGGAINNSLWDSGIPVIL